MEKVEDQYIINLEGSDMSVPKIVRKANLDPDTEIIVSRDGREAFKRYPASKWASISIRENELIGPRMVKYVPFKGIINDGV